MDPKIWGPKLWFSLHTITFNYPNNPTYLDKRFYHDFFTNLKHVIPCSVCKNHYSQHLENYPISPNLDNKELLIRWLVNLHNVVNKSLGKRTYSHQEVMEIYKNHYSNKYVDPIVETTNKSSYIKYYWKIILFILLIGSSITVYIRCFKKRSIF